MYTAIKMYKGLIQPYFDYCRAAWDGLTQHLSEKLQKLQNRAIRGILKSSYDTSSRCLVNSLVWDGLSVRRATQKANLMHKCINNLAPAYLRNLFTVCLPKNTELLYWQRQEKLIVPKPRTDYLKRSLRSMAVLSEARLSGEAEKTREDTRQICKTVFENF